jgi:hypothetical protein
MKIEGPNKTQSSDPAKKKNKASESQGGFEDLISRAPEQASSASASNQIASVDSLLSIQAAEDPTESAARGRMRERSDNILKDLEQIRLAMLAGNLTVGHMIDIADVVASHREKIQDPGLVEIMDEIDLRANVELAKMRATLEKSADAKIERTSF